MKGLVSALQILSIIPVPGQTEHTRPGGKSLPWFPVVGFGFALVVAGTGLFFQFQFPAMAGPDLPAALLVVAGVLLSGGLHLDGLMDWADGTGVNGEPEERLRVMKEPGVGSFGVMAGLVSILTKYACLVLFFQSNILFWLVPVYVLSRFSQVHLISRGKSIPGRKGMASHIEQEAHTGYSGMAFLLTGLILFLTGGLWALLLVPFSLLLTEYALWRWMHDFGGITGDLVGTINEAQEMLLFFIITLLIPDLPPVYIVVPTFLFP